MFILDCDKELQLTGLDYKDFGLGGCRVGFLVTYNEQLFQAMRTCR